MDSGGNAALGVIVGAVLVIALLFWIFGGFGGRGDGPDVAVDLPNVEVNR
jgi:hypothetical protein